MGAPFARLPLAVLNDPTLTPSQVRVYARLASHINRENGAEVFPTEEQVAAALGCSERTVVRAVKALEVAGHIEVRRRDNRRNNVYSLRAFEVTSNAAEVTCVSGRGDISGAFEVTPMSSYQEGKIKKKHQDGRAKRWETPPASLAIMRKMLKLDDNGEPEDRVLVSASESAEPIDLTDLLT
jgi:DNA-binding transcriptional MocR family regulator